MHHRSCQSLRGRNSTVTRPNEMTGHSLRTDLGFRLRFRLRARP
jgi:hypothetical protein